MARIQMRCCLIHDQNRGPAQQGSCQRKALTFPPGQAGPVLSDEGLVTVGQGLNEIMGVRRFSRRRNLIRTGRRIADGDVGLNGVIKQEDVLTDQGDVFQNSF